MRMNAIAGAAMTAMALAATGAVVSAGDSMWTRTTVLLEPPASSEVAPEELLVPAGVVFADDLDSEALADFDRSAVLRAQRLGAKIAEVEAAMRLRPLMVRQYHLRLVANEGTSLPVMDLNPRFGTTLRLSRLTPETATFDVELLYDTRDWARPKFTGDAVTMSLVDADVRRVLETFSMLTGTPIEVDRDVTGTVSVDFRSVPWDQALDLILTTNDLGWEAEGDGIRVSRLEALNSRREVLAKATVSIDRSPDGLAMIAGRDGPETPTVVLVVEPVAGDPLVPPEHGWLVRFLEFQPPVLASSDPVGSVVVVRVTVTAEGEIEQPAILSSPSPSAGDAVLAATSEWRMAPVRDRTGRSREAIVAFGVRVGDSR